MNIEEFFEMSAGKWFSHRSTHHLAFNQSEDGKSDITIETLATDHPEVIKLCQLYEIDPSSAACSARVTWNETRERDKQKYSGSTVIVTVPDVDHRDQGKLLRQTSSANQAPVIGSYKIGSDDALTLTVKSETMYSEERLWFASPNLRMRARVLKRLDGFSLADFTSEIRMGGTPSATKVSETAKSSS